MANCCRIAGNLKYSTDLSSPGAYVQLAFWMDGLELSEDDEALLCHIGAVLYREGLRRRMGMRR